MAFESGTQRVYAEVVEAEWHAWLKGETSLMRRLVEDHANIRAAVALALATRDVDLVHGIGAGVGRFCADFGHLEEGRTLLDAMLLLAEDEPERPWGWVYVRRRHDRHKAGPVRGRRAHLHEGAGELQACRR